VNARSVAVVVIGALGQLAVWLVTRPDLAGPRWSQGHSTEVWLALEALAAVLIGSVAPDRAAAVRAVLVGWGLQMAHFAFLGDHYDDTLWGVGLYLEAFLAAVAVGLALLARRVTDSDRRRSRA
jgi:peptidoglycan/LPS O-acetylase OafA/YrhL